MKCLWIFLLASLLSSTLVMAKDKVVVIPLTEKQELEPGTVVEGDLNNAILTVINNHSTETLGSAIRATGSSPTAPVISANHTGIGHALYGSSSCGYPSVGGVNSDTGPGVEGRSTSGIGINGVTSSTDSSGVVGLQQGNSLSDLGEHMTPGGFFAGRNGVVGLTKTDNGIGVLGLDKSPSSGWAGKFISENANGISISVQGSKVGLNVTGGTKNAVVATEDGARLMYSEESAEVWFTDYGFGTIENGQTHITFDSVFAQTVNLNKPYHVFVQPYGNASLYVTDRSPDGFTVYSDNGNSNIEFSYRVVALRLGHEGKRLERAPWADDDPNLFPQ